MTTATTPTRTWLPRALLLIATLCIAVVYFAATLALPTPALADPLGPQIFPILVSGGLFLSAALMLFELWRTHRASGAGQPAVHSQPFDLRSWLMVAGISAWTALYFLTFERAGFLISTTVFLFGLMSVFHAGHRRTNLACAAGFSVGAWILFVKVLSVRLPSGILPF